MIITILAMLLTSPKDIWIYSNTPFKRIIRLLEREYKQRLDLELYSSISQLKNIAVLGESRPLGTDFIITKLMKFSKLTKPIFAKTLYIWQLGEYDRAMSYFSQAIDTTLSRELAGIIRKLDDMNPIEFHEQLEIFQENTRQIRATYIQKRDEVLSNLIYIPIIASAFVVLLNFVVVTIFLDQIQNMIKL